MCLNDTLSINLRTPLSYLHRSLKNNYEKKLFDIL